MKSQLRKVPKTCPKSSAILTDLYQRYWNSLCTYVHAQFGPGPPEPEDIAQQVFEKFSRLEQDTEVRSPKAFLYKMAHNIVISEKRHLNVRKKYTDKLQNESFNYLGDELTPERVFIAKEQFNIVEKIIKQMPKKRRRMLLMNRVYGLSYVEIAKRFGVSDTAIKKQVYKALSQLDEVINTSESDIK